VNPVSGEIVVLSAGGLLGDGDGIAVVPAGVPEPATILLLATGLVALAWRVRRA
jgi:hypothetical protein